VQSGASIVNDAVTAYASDIILKVQAPTAEEIALIKEGATVVAMFDPYRNPNLAAFCG
jgi:NAD(P) transhydrogenase subunit alpha